MAETNPVAHPGNFFSADTRAALTDVGFDLSPGQVPATVRGPLANQVAEAKTWTPLPDRIDTPGAGEPLLAATLAAAEIVGETVTRLGLSGRQRLYIQSLYEDGQVTEVHLAEATYVQEDKFDKRLLLRLGETATGIRLALGVETKRPVLDGTQPLPGGFAAGMEWQAGEVPVAGWHYHDLRLVQEPNAPGTSQ